jgi:hypothetical protein
MGISFWSCDKKPKISTILSQLGKLARERKKNRMRKKERKKERGRKEGRRDRRKEGRKEKEKKERKKKEKKDRNECLDLPSWNYNTVLFFF